MVKTVRVGVIGGGIWGKFHLQAAKELEDQGRVTLTAVATRTEKSAAERSQEYGIKGYTDYKAMIAEQDLDAVTVATPDHLHRAIGLHAIKNKKHVLVEKPMDLTTAGCREMVEAAAANKVLLQVDFHKRYDPNNIDARSKVKTGTIGTPHYAYAYMEDKIIVPTEWLAGWAANSSPFWFIGIHKYDLIRWITGREAVTVRAHGRKGKLVEMGIDTYDSVSASIVMEGGMTCNIDVNWILPRQFEAVVNQGLRIVGSEGIIEIDAQDRGMRSCTSSDGNVTPNFNAFFSYESGFGEKSVAGYFVDPIKDFLRNVSFVKSGGNPEDLEGRYPSGLDGLKATQLAEAVENSMKNGEVISLA
jgi:predicted dehydrogenase